MPTATQAAGPNLRPTVRLLARLTRVVERTCQQSGISLPQYRLLVALSDGPQRASSLAHRIGVSRPTLTSLVDGLEREGLLVRKPVARDRRGVDLSLTQEGFEAIERAERVLSERLSEMLPHEDQIRGTAFVDELVRSMDRENG